jgi:hypothetical protein
MATHKGNSGAVYSGTKAVAEIKDWSLETTSEVVADTVMGDSWVSNKPTLKSWTSSFNAFWDYSANIDGTDPAQPNGQLDLVEGAEITLNLYPEGNTSTKIYWSGACIITSVSKSSSFDGLIEASFSVTGNGELTETAVV